MKKRWLGVALSLACCSRGGVGADDDRDLSKPDEESRDLAEVDLSGADLSGADLSAAPDLASAAPSEFDCYYNWKTRSGCPAPQISDSYFSQNCVGTTGVFVVGRYFQHGNQYESKNGWMPHGPYALTNRLNRETWNWLSPGLVCITTSNDASTWSGFEMQLRNPDGQVSNKVTVVNRSGSRPVLASSGSNDPFDLSACYDPGMTQAQAVAKFPMAASMTTLGTLTIWRRSRPCNTLTGCGAWGPASTEATVAARLQTSGDVHFALGTTDCGSLSTTATTPTYNTCTTTGGAGSYSVHVANSCLTLWQTVRTAIAGDNSYTQTDYGGLLRY